MKKYLPDTNILTERGHAGDWGDRKVSVRNLIVLNNHKPMEEFQYVKILTLKELCAYVKYFPRVLSKPETQRIADYLLKMTD